MLQEVGSFDHFDHLALKIVRLCPLPVLVPAIEIILSGTSLPLVYGNCGHIRRRHRQFAGMTARTALGEDFLAAGDKRVIHLKRLLSVRIWFPQVLKGMRSCCLEEEEPHGGGLRLSGSKIGRIFARSS